MTDQLLPTTSQEDLIDIRPVKVFVIDDHPGYRSLVGEVLALTNGFEAVGGSPSWKAAHEILSVRSQLPDLVLMDVNLGTESGVAGARALHDQWPNIKVVLISTMDQADLPPEAPHCGAAGFLPKARLSPREIAQAWQGAYDWPS